ncbi:chaperone protein DNAj [Perkinsela sp. CCAP 1560/4]|nr:chaperone protein DNAj [Perkinsela sp. CCAP 1560/4]|eukprot:KNH09233.1 chaperone protein DNAj [Perkinsela sp. CCAP 1560/4]
MTLSATFTEAILGFQKAIEGIEDFTFTPPPLEKILKVLAAGVPVSILLDRVFNQWYSHIYPIPLFSSLARWWNQDVQLKQEHLKLIRNLACFGIAAVAVNLSEKSRHTTSDFLVDRLMSSTAQKSVKAVIHTPQRAAYEAAHELMLTTGTEESQVAHQLDAEVRRRAARETGSK